MRRLLMSMLLSGGALCAIAQGAPIAASSAGDEGPLPAQAVRLFPQDLDAYQGKYFLSNGQTMVLRRAGLRLVAEIAGGPPQPLVATAANEFVSTDRRLKLKLTLVDEGLGGIRGQVEMMLPRHMTQQSNAGQGDVARLAIR
ncbi:MAG TPA: hypothetical protein VFS02_17215 [Telluria sp.]|nr:hypothetical protein [Telluria sp.]